MNFRIVPCLAIFSISLLIAACGGGGGSSDSTVPDPDPTTSSKFQEVLPIIGDNCQSCHGSSPSNGAPMSLTTYSQISFFASKISQRINKNVGDNQLMPNSGSKLSNADIAIIDSWVDAGALNN